MKKLFTIALFTSLTVIAATAQTQHNLSAPATLVYPVQQVHAELLTVQYNPYKGSCQIFGYWHPVDWNNNVYGVDNSGNPINQIVGSVSQIQGNSWSFYWNANGVSYNVFCR